MKKYNFIKDILFTEEDIQKSIIFVSEKIRSYYNSVLGVNSVNSNKFQIITVLNGGLKITEYLIKTLRITTASPIHILTSSYSGIEQMDSISVKFSDADYGRLSSIKDKYVLVIDDILDSGRTLSTVKNEIEKYSPKDIQFCVLLERKIKRDIDIQPKFIALPLEGLDYVVGCGLDLDGGFRELPYIASIKNEKDETWDPKNRRNCRLVICNKCESICNVQQDGEIWNDVYGLINANVSGGYFSKYLEDGSEYSFDLCEKCVSELFDTFKILPDKIDHGI